MRAEGCPSALDRSQRHCVWFFQIGAFCFLEPLFELPDRVRGAMRFVERGQPVIFAQVGQFE